MGLARMWARHLEQAVFAGDEDQTIYTFKGANPRALTTLEYDHIRVLSQSFRVPAAVHQLAQRITGRISDRYPAEYHPREGAEGAVLREPPTGVRQRNPRGLARIIGETEGSVMVLASTNAGLNNTIAELLGAGIPFHNPYRVEQTVWNPLQAANGVSFAQRVSAFHRPARAGDLWTVQ